MKPFSNNNALQDYTSKMLGTYILQPIQQISQKQQSKIRAIEILFKELNLLRSRVKELSQQRAQQQTLKILSIQIPIRFSIMTNDQGSVSDIGVGKATRKIKMTARNNYGPMILFKKSKIYSTL